MTSRNVSTSTDRDWSISDSDRLYRISSWSDRYYQVNDAGHMAVCPSGDPEVQIDLKNLVDDLRGRNIHPPVLIRFMDILSHRVKKLYDCFTKARQMFDYPREYYPVYPIKVNPQRQVVEAMINAGAAYNIGLEVGSKAELLAAIALSPTNDQLIICNGYKDDRFIETALYAKQMGKSVIIVADHLSEIKKIVAVAKRVQVVPALGIRIKLSSKANGRWSDTAGDASKFGLSVSELMQAITHLQENELLHAFTLIHFHIGSQISQIQNIKLAMTEIARIYVSLIKMNVDIDYVDVGGGLGVDYDGSSSNNTFSTNYS